MTISPGSCCRSKNNGGKLGEFWKNRYGKEFEAAVEKGSIGAIIGPVKAKDGFVIAKVERAGALDRIDEIVDEADGIMVARGDLGVEVPVERIAVLQKDLVRRAAAASTARRPGMLCAATLQSTVQSTATANGRLSSMNWRFP